MRDLEEFRKEFRPLLAKTGQTFYDRAEGMICHYTSSNGLLGILQSQSLWFTELSGLNDSTEGTYIWDIVKECLANNYDEDFNAAIMALEEDQYKLPDNTEGEVKPKLYFICSFSESSDSLSMWNYYTKSVNSVGYNICFDKQKLLKKVEKDCPDFEVKLFKVLYDVNKQKELISTQLNIIYKHWKRLWSRDRAVLLEYFKVSIEFSKVGFKHPSFVNEQEVRLVIELDGDQFLDNLSKKPLQKEVKLRVVNNEFIPYIESKFKDLNVIQRITASPIIKDKDAVDSLVLLLYKYGCVDVCEICASKIPLRF